MTILSSISSISNQYGKVHIHGPYFHHFPSTIQYVWILSDDLIQKPYEKFLRCSIAENFTSCAVFWRAHYTPKRLKKIFLTTTGRNFATWSANLPLSIRVQTTLHHYGSATSQTSLIHSSRSIQRSNIHQSARLHPSLERITKSTLRSKIVQFAK